MPWPKGAALPLHPKPKPSASSLRLGAWEKQTLCAPSTAITQDVSPRMKICSHRRKELENLCIILPPTNTHYLWIISLAFIPLKNEVDLTNTVMFLMTCFLDIWQLHLKKKKPTQIVAWFTAAGTDRPCSQRWVQCLRQGSLCWRRQEPVQGYALAMHFSQWYCLLWESWVTAGPGRLTVLLAAASVLRAV